MVYTINHKGSANEDHNEIAPHTTTMIIRKRQIITNVGEDVEKLGPSNTASGSVKWYSCFRKHLAIP